MTVILDPESAEHWLAVQDFREEMDGARPEDIFGADGYVIMLVDGRSMIGLTEAGLRRVEELAVGAAGPGALAWLDQVVAKFHAPDDTEQAPGGP